MRTLVVTTLACALTAVAAAGAATAVTTGGTQVHACVDKKSGAVSVKKKCTSKQRVLTLGTAGPQGPAGANGTNGINGTNGTNGHDGAKGDTGPSDVYAWTATSTSGTLPTPGLPATALTVISGLPAGSYSVLLDVNATNSSDADRAITCFVTYSPQGTTAFSGNPAELYIAPSTTLPLNSHYALGSAAASDAVTLSAPTDVAVTCNTTAYFAAPGIDNISVTATKAGTLHLSP